MHAADLPPELWLQVFNWFIDPGSLGALTEDYIPFEKSGDIIQGVTHRFQARRTISTVCRQWRALLRQAVFTEITLTNHGTHALQRALRDNGESDPHDRQPNGSLVRIMVLPYDATQTTAFSDSPEQCSTDTIRLCPNLRILIRPPPLFSAHQRPLTFEFSTSELPLLSSLHRLEWSYHDPASRTGGINALHEVLSQAPNLRYLSIGGTMPYARHRLIELKQLTTLRLVGFINPLEVRQICTWSLPALTHVVLAGVAVSFSMLWDALGNHIKTIELGMHMRFLADDVCLANLLDQCKNLETLNYHVYFTRIPRNEDDRDLEHLGARRVVPREHVHTVGLHCLTNQSLGEEEIEFAHLEQHLLWITDKRYFPALQSIRLYGGWEEIAYIMRIREILTVLDDQGYEIQWL
jgi:hypothetical protein